MRTRYIYNYKFSIKNTVNGPVVKKQKAPVGCIVVNDGRIGVSFCNLEKDHFNKKLARHIASERSMICEDYHSHIPNRKITNVLGDRTKVENEVEFFVNRALEKVKV